VTVPGPMKAAEIIDQNKILSILLFMVFRTLFFIFDY